MEINYGASCVCQKKKISICRKCELCDSLKIANAFEKCGYMVVYEYCERHYYNNVKGAN